MNPFEKHGLTHLSPTQINNFAADPAFWAYKYLVRGSDSVGPSAWRGSAVEAGLDYWLFKRDRGAAQKAALDRFELEAMGELSEKLDKQRANIFPMLDQAIELFDDKPEPTVRQFDIEYWIEGIEVPLVGKLDYEWPDEGYDLKTTERMPSQIRDGHGRQISVYQVARGKPYKLAYVTPKKGQILELQKEEYERYLRQVAWYAHTIRRGLATFSDSLELARIYRPDFTNFHWSNPETVAEAKKFWEIE